MAFKEVNSLDAAVTIALGKTNKETGKPYPKQAEGYYLGSREVENKRGKSKLHFLQTPKGNLGIWGTTDLDRKMGQTGLGSMVRITSTGTKPTPNGDMYVYKVEVDTDNTIPILSSGSNGGSVEDELEQYQGENNEEDEQNEDSENDAAEDYESVMNTPAAVAASSANSRAAKVQELLNKKRK